MRARSTCFREVVFAMSNHQSIKLFAVGCLTFLLLADAPALYAQAVSIATVTGRLTDQQGALVTGAQIRVTGVDTGAVHNAITNEDGIYTIPSLPIGAYTFQAT